MCGITGFAGSGDQSDILRMLNSLAHRGPDDQGLWHDSDKAIFLGHRRLSIIDLAGGRQPMWADEGELGIVFNGIIFNHLELRAELESRDHRFQTDHSDTEALLLGYKEWGKNVTEKLNGMWAFAILDRKRNEIFLSRDRFGKKPLYYSFQNGTFAFSSELKSLIRHSNISANISPIGLKKYFAYGFIPSPHCIFNNIFKLPGGYNLTVNTSNLRITLDKYWEFKIEPFEDIPKNPEEEWGGRLIELLSQAVNRRLISDVPLGIFLSGGIDSSTVAALATNLVGRQGVKTFSIGFEESSFDESAYSRRAASYLGTDHHSEVLSIESAKSILPQITNKLDEPLGDSSILPTYLLCRETRKHVTVALGGDGADELFAGYDPFHALKLGEIYSAIAPKPIHEAIKLIALKFPVSFRNMSFDFKIKRALHGLSYSKILWNPVWLGPLEPREIQELFEDRVDLEEIYSDAIECWDNCLQQNILNKTLQFYTRLYLQDAILTKVDRASMMNSLEVRAPFLDIDLVDFVRRLPGDFKYRNGQTKYLLKKALKRILPHDIIYRAKHGFGVPVAKWFQEENLKWNNDRSSPLMNSSFVDKKRAEHIKKKQDNRLFLWNYWVLQEYIMSVE